MGRLIDEIKWIRLRREWFRRNSHNHCSINKPFDIDKVTIGNGTYGMIDPYFYGNPNCRLIIGSYCSIAEGTRFVYGEHDYNRLSTYPFDEFVLRNKEINRIKGPIVLEDDVWIGMNSIILSGVTIHQGAIVGAGSVVSKDIPPYAIYAGNRIIKYRFEKDYIEKLLEVDFNRLKENDIKNFRDTIYSDVNDDFFNSELYKNIRRSYVK